MIKNILFAFILCFLFVSNNLAEPKDEATLFIYNAIDKGAQAVGQTWSFTTN